MWICPNCAARNWDADTICCKCRALIVLDRSSAAEQWKTLHWAEPPTPVYPPLTPRAQIELTERLRTIFEGKEAILYEHGLLRVRVSDIRPRVGSMLLQVEEIPTRGLGVGGFQRLRKNGPPGPWRCRLSAGFQSCFSNESWSLGYGGGSLLFSPPAIQAIVERAAELADEPDPGKRYYEVCRASPLSKPQLRREPLFPNDEKQRAVILNAEPAIAKMSSDWVDCPRCGMAFKPSDLSRWDGERHLSCGQRLIVEEH